MLSGCIDETAVLRTGVDEALVKAEEYEGRLDDSRGSGMIENIVLGVAVVTVLALALALPDFFLFWIIASFLLYMINPFVMAVPSSGGGMAIPTADEIRAYASRLKGLAKSRGTAASEGSVIVEVFWNLFFINCQPLAPAFWLIYSIDIAIALIGGVTGTFGLRFTLLVAVQSLSIIAFYAVIWCMKPYSPGFFQGVIDLRHDVRAGIKEGIRSAVAILLVIGAGAAIAGTLVIAAMLLPGMTFNKLMDLEGITLLQTLLPVIPILLAQIFIVRYLQGKYSQVLLGGVMKERIRALKGQILPALDDLADRAVQNGADVYEELDELREQFLRMVVYQPGRHTLGGAFTVYVIFPNLNLVFRPGNGKKRVSDQ